VSSLFFCYCAWVTQKTVLVSLTPLYSLQKRPIRRLTTFLTVWNTITSVVFIGFGIFMLIFTRERHQLSTYNYAAVGLAVAFYICGAVDTFAMFLSSSKLYRKLSSMEKEIAQNLIGNRSNASAQQHNTFDSYQAFKRRLRLLQFNSMGIFIPYTALAIAVPVTVYVYGSFPYFYLALYLILVTSAFFFTGALLLFVNPATGRGVNSTNGGGDVSAKEKKSSKELPIAIGQNQRLAASLTGNNADAVVAVEPASMRMEEEDRNFEELSRVSTGGHHLSQDV